jgi:hypothetical protein
MPITDSPWFWAMLFCAVGVVLLLVISPRYAPRQRRLEMQYRAREEMLRRGAEGETAPRPAGQEGAAPPPAPGELIIPLWPLVAVFTLGMLASAALLHRSRRPRPTSPLPPGGPS